MKKEGLLDRFHLFRGHMDRMSDGPLQEESSSAFVPILLEHPQTQMEYRQFLEDYQKGGFLLDTYEVRNIGERMIRYPVLPSPCMCLYFKLGGEVPLAIFSGMSSAISFLEIPVNHTVFCVRFLPGVAPLFTKTPAKKLKNTAFPLSVFLPAASELVREIRESSCFEQRVQKMQAYFRAHPRISEHEDHTTFYRGVEMIHRRHGVLRVSEVAGELSCSERYLCRMFNNWVGTSTKQYCELIQLQFSLREILSKRPRTLAKTAMTFGYFDQPHMNRVYQKFLGRTASDMLFLDDASCNTAGSSVII